MEFWGEEVKPGCTVHCEVGDGFVIHLSQAALGETKKESENVVLSVKVGDKKLVIGTLSADKHPQILCDLVFDGDFELSHNSKNSSVFLCGYTTEMPDEFGYPYEGESEDEDMEADENLVKNNITAKVAAKVPAKDGKKDKHESDSETSSGEDPSGSDSEDDTMFEDDSSDEDDVSSGTDDLSDGSEDEETPVPEVGKKRTSALKGPSDKKAKISTPEKGIGSKKGAHVATPHPAKQANKTPADGKLKEKAPKTPADGKLKEKVPKTPADSKPKEKAPKTPAESKGKENSPKSGSHSCKSCSRIFGSAGALESHQKAKKH